MEVIIIAGSIYYRRSRGTTEERIMKIRSLERGSLVLMLRPLGWTRRRGCLSGWS